MPEAREAPSIAVLCLEGEDVTSHSDFAQRYQELTQRLGPFAACWNQSVLHFWPACRDALPEDWWVPLLPLSLESLYQLDEWISSGGETAEPEAVPDGLREFLRGVSPALQFERVSAPQILSEAQALRMTPKKQHEIGAILPFLAERKHIFNFDHGVDIGGGAGHLARTLQQGLDLPMISIDRDAALHALGRELSRKHSVSEDQLCFVTSEIQPAAQEIDRHFAGRSLSLGLHTCGPLAWSHLQKSQPSLGLLNFGCCYDRMDPAVDCQRSAFAQQHSLPLTSFALFLATRGRRRTQMELNMQERVNTYRIALHLFLIDAGLASGFVTVGDAPRRDYLQGFTAYATARLRFLQWDTPALLTRVKYFAEDPSVQRSMREFFIINIVRNAFARPLEVTLLLDRALWLEEQGRTVSMRQFFDQTISPRNLGIFASRV